ncbi:MAG TPA: helix-turn-helix domain-containing protein [Blastocatellia bacterium]|nr:helix-turn-helix domain-containing protein [Blastocatellia bacterium]HMV82445.1 helix-turn-helix domain-containing protein [Blastocatellia bacterium]HNG31136.1 helix-turn-helix domain-containing protein [Blastocatellia bacterium]
MPYTRGMNSFVKVLALINLLGAAQAILLAAALLTIQRGNRTANRLLAAFIFVMAVLVSGALVFTTRHVLAYPHLSYLHHPFLYLTAPLLFLYVRALTESQDRFARRDWLHFLPFALCLLYLLPFYLQSAEAKLTVFNSPDYERWYLLRHGLAMAQMIPYLSLTVARLIRFAREQQPVNRTMLFQLGLLTTGIGLILVGIVIRFLFHDRSLQTNLLLPSIGPILVYALAYLALRKPEAFAGGVRPEPEPQSVLQTEPVAQPKKYERSTLTPERAEEYLARLMRAMESEKLFTDGDMTLQKLAEHLAIPAAHLSQVVNERCNQTFNDFINSYRVREAQAKLLDPATKHYSILAIAEEVGFNSKSTFNAVFKKHTGQTPSEFRESSKALETA